MFSSALGRLVVIVGVLAGFPGGAASGWEPVRAHPQNPYILEFRGQPTLLRTYGPHYGWLFDSSLSPTPHFDVFQRDGMNLTRIWCMGYPTGTPQNFSQPWQRATTGGNALDGLKKWDFDTWDEAYFTRLKGIAQAASDRGIVVEFTFFSVLYEVSVWEKSPFHRSNNLQGFGSQTNRYDCLRQNSVNAQLFERQLAAVRRIVRELNGFDNVIYEIVNEPFWNEPGIKDAEEVAFHNTMLAAIREEEAVLPNRHLVAHNFPQQISAMSTGFDILNEHYPAPAPETAIAGAEALLSNHYSRGRILSLDETNTETEPQTRLEAWMFFIGGGGIYNGLDYEEVAYNQATPSGDNAIGNSIRGAVRNSWTYMNGLHLVALRRNLAWVLGGIPAGATLQASSSPGQQYAAYLHHGQKSLTNFQLNYNPIINSVQNVSLSVTLPAGNWRAVWTRPFDLTEIAVQTLDHPGGALTLAPVTYQTDVALRIDRIDGGDTTPPPPPAAPAAVPVDDGSISLSWVPVPVFDLAGYYVYRSESPVVPIDSIHRIAHVSAPATGFSDPSVVFGNNYFYAVTALDVRGNESSTSLHVQAASAPAYPEISVSEPVFGQFVVQWAAASPGWYLQENRSLSPDTWIYSTLVPTVVGENYQVIVTPTSERRFFRLTHEPPTPPGIHFSSNDQGEFFLSWTAAVEGWHLQESADISPDSWRYSTLAPVLVGENYQVAYAPSAERRFFRLVWPPPPPPADPILNMVRNGDGQMVLEWPAPSSGWVLQASPSLSPDTWTDIVETPTLFGDQYRLIVTPTGHSRFYRLIRR